METGCKAGGPPGTRGAAAVSIVLEAPIPKRSFGDKTSLYVIHIYIYNIYIYIHVYIYIYIYIYMYSDKQQLSHKIGWPVLHTRQLRGPPLGRVGLARGRKPKPGFRILRFLGLCRMTEAPFFCRSTPPKKKPRLPPSLV